MAVSDGMLATISFFKTEHENEPILLKIIFPFETPGFGKLIKTSTYYTFPYASLNASPTSPLFDLF